MHSNEMVLSDRELDELFAANDSYSMRVSVKRTGDSVPSSPTFSSAPSSPALSAQEDKGDMIPLPEGVVPQRCGYRTGKCQHLQAVKRNGKLHKLCEFHREKANQNQKKLDRKKRQQRFSPYDQMSSDDESGSSMMDHYSPRAIEDHHRHHHHHHMQQQHYASFEPRPTSLHEAPLALAGEELAIFYNIMTFDIHQFSAYVRPHATAAPQYHAHQHQQHSHHRSHHAQYSVV